MDGVVALPGDWQGRITPVRIREWTGLAIAYPEFSCREPSDDHSDETRNLQPKHDNQNHLRAATVNSPLPARRAGQPAACGGMVLTPKNLTRRSADQLEKQRPLPSQGGLDSSQQGTPANLRHQKSLAHPH